MSIEESFPAQDLLCGTLPNTLKIKRFLWPTVVLASWITKKENVLRSCPAGVREMAQQVKTRAAQTAWLEFYP